jgi:SpoIID/LytB domain protein
MMERLPVHPRQEHVAMRLRFTSAAVACLAAAALVAAPQVSSADERSGRVSVSQSYPVPGSGKYTVRGRGYGHGHGMSQWGAQGAALQGMSAAQILDFYYPGTTLSTMKGKVRVLITGDTTSSVIVNARSGLRLRDLGSGASYSLPNAFNATRWQLTVDNQNRNIVQYYNGTWNDYSPGGHSTLSGEGEFYADGPLTLLMPSGAERAYRGALRAAEPSSSSTNRDTVNVLALDSYIKGVVPSEAYTSWQPAALQAQAVAARTYAAFERAENVDRYYQICDTSSCQVYGGLDKEVDSTNAAVHATSHQILRYGGEPAFTQFSSSSGGWTSAGGFPYLVAKADPYDDAPGNGNHSWSVALTASRIQGAYPSLGKLQRIRVTSRDGNGEWQGRVLSMVLVGSKHSVTLSGDSFRSKFGLKSSWFSF